MDKLISLCKRRGFIYQGSEIYGGLAGTWDYGPLGVALKKNIENIWWKRFVTDRDDMYGIDAAILMNPEVWKSSGHVDGFSDSLEDESGEVKQFNMMFETKIGATEETSSISYLRPETAGGMFVNFKNVVDSFHPKLPFGLAQIGKAFRNEIAPRDFIFRVRELEQMEIEYFVKPDRWAEAFDEFRGQVHAYFEDLGITKEKIHELEIADNDRAHYSKRTIDFEFDYEGLGRRELSGLAYRTDFDLKSHSDGSKVDLSYFDDSANSSEQEETHSTSSGQAKRFFPHVIEPSFGVGRTMLAILSDAYKEDELGGEARTYLKLSPAIAPYLVAVFPLLKNRPELIAKAKEVYQMLKKEFPGRVMFDDNGNIGKRYRRQDEIGTPFCITVDFDTLGENQELLDTVTLRDRDTGNQNRVSISNLTSEIKKNLQ